MTMLSICRVLLCCTLYTLARAVVLNKPSLALTPNISQNVSLGSEEAPTGPPPGAPGSSSSPILCWYPDPNRLTIASPSDCNSALNLLLHEPGILRPRVFGIIPTPGQAQVPDAWEFQSCSIQLRYMTFTADFDPDRFRYLDVASVARRIMNRCIKGGKAPQGGSGWVGNNRGYFVTMQGRKEMVGLADAGSSSLPKALKTTASLSPSVSASSPDQKIPATSTHDPLTPSLVHITPRAQPSSSSSSSFPPPAVPPPASPSPSIQCFPHSAGKPTSITGCRPTLNHIRQHYTPYRTPQLFKMYRYPREPFTPPISHLHIPPSDCVIQVFSRISAVEDRFSWEEVRRKAMEVLEFCGEHGDGVGGAMGLGRGLGWNVVVLGMRTVPEEGGGESEEGGGYVGVMELAGGNGTEVGSRKG